MARVWRISSQTVVFFQKLAAVMESMVAGSMAEKEEMFP